MTRALSITGASSKEPPTSGSSNAANMLGLSKFGQQRKSIAPSSATSAIVDRLPIAPWSATVLFGTVIGFAEDLSVSDAHRVKLSIVFEPLVHADVSVGCGFRGGIDAEVGMVEADHARRDIDDPAAIAEATRALAHATEHAAQVDRD